MCICEERPRKPGTTTHANDACIVVVTTANAPCQKNQKYVWCVWCRSCTHYTHRCILNPIEGYARMFGPRENTCKNSSRSGTYLAEPNFHVPYQRTPIIFVFKHLLEKRQGLEAFSNKIKARTKHARQHTYGSDVTQEEKTLFKKQTTRIQK